MVKSINNPQRASRAVWITLGSPCSKNVDIASHISISLFYSTSEQLFMGSLNMSHQLTRIQFEKIDGREKISAGYMKFEKW